MLIVLGKYVQLKFKEMEDLARQTTYEWPHVWARFNCEIRDFTRLFSSNHIHAAVGDVCGEMITCCNELDIEPLLIE